MYVGSLDGVGAVNCYMNWQQLDVSCNLLWHDWKSGLWEAEFLEPIKMFLINVLWHGWKLGFVGSWNYGTHQDVFDSFVVTWLKVRFRDVFEYICCDMVEIWFLEAEFMEVPIEKVLSNSLWHGWNLVFGNLILWKPMKMFLRNLFWQFEIWFLGSWTLQNQSRCFDALS
jgi:hypothetical protein